MKLNYYFYSIGILLFACLIISSCKSDPIDPILNPENEHSLRSIDDNTIYFGHPQVGQESHYVNFRGFVDGSFHYFKDTIVARVKSVNFDNDTFLIQEFLKPLSESLQGSDTSFVGNPMDTVEFLMVKGQNRIRFVEAKDDLFKSRLMRFLLAGEYENNGSLDFYLPNNTNKQWAIDNWGNNFVYADSNRNGYLLNTEIQGFTYDYLNGERSYEEYVIDGSGYVKLYGNDYGLVKVLAVEGMLGVGFGWELIKNEAE